MLSWRPVLWPSLKPPRFHYKYMCIDHSFIEASSSPTWHSWEKASNSGICWTTPSMSLVTQLWHRQTSHHWPGSSNSSIPQHHEPQWLCRQHGWSPYITTFHSCFTAYPPVSMHTSEYQNSLPWSPLLENLSQELTLMKAQLLFC